MHTDAFAAPTRVGLSRCGRSLVPAPAESTGPARRKGQAATRASCARALAPDQNPRTYPVARHHDQAGRPGHAPARGEIRRKASAMSITTAITVVGNLTEDPALRFTQSGTAVASVTIASTERYFDRSSNEWKDGETTFVRGTVWKNNGAENLAESLAKGARVIAHGKLKQRTYDDRDGNKRSVIEMDIEEIGPSVKYATAKPVKPQQRDAQAPADAWQTAGV